MTNLQGYASGLVVGISPKSSVIGEVKSLNDFLIKNEIVAISGIDTRQLTSVLRENGSLKGAILSGKDIGTYELEKVLDSAREFGGLVGVDLAREVSSAQPFFWNEKPWDIDLGFTKSEDAKYKVGLRFE